MISNNLQAIRDAVAAQLKARLPATANVYARYPKALNNPSFVVVRQQTTYNPTFEIGAEHTLAVRAFLAFSDLTGSQQLLDDVCAPTGAWSVPAAISYDPRLGGVVDWCRIASAEDERQTDYAGITYLTVDLVLEVG